LLFSLGLLLFLTMKTKKRGRPSTISWKVNGAMWKTWTDTEIALYLNTSQPNVRRKRAQLIAEGNRDAQYVHGQNANRRVRKERFNTPYRTHKGGAYSLG